MAQYVFGIRFYLRSAVAADSSVGIYTVAGQNSQIRLIEDDITTLMPTVAWKTGLLRENAPFDAFEESMTLDNGGCMPEIGGSTVYIANGAKFCKTIADAGINFVGLVCEVVIFEVVNGALVNPDGTVFRRRIADAPSWDEYDCSIRLKDARTKRRANLSNLISTTNYTNAEGSVIGKSTPLTVGKLWSPIGSDGLFTRNVFAKLIRVANKQTRFCNDMYTFNHRSVITPGQQYVFPLVVMATGGSPLTYGIQLGTSTPALDDVIDFTQYYMLIVEGDGSGEYRKISSYVVPSVSLVPVLTVTVSDYYTKTLQGNSSATADNQAWVSFIKADRQYLADEWPCIGFLDDAGVPATNGQNAIYAYSNDQKVSVSALDTATLVQEQKWDFRKIPEWAFTSNLLGNLLTVDLKFFNSNIDQVESVIILPCVGVNLFRDGNMGAFRCADDTFEWQYMYAGGPPGIFLRRGEGLIGHSLTPNYGQISNVTDRNGNTYWELVVDVTEYPGSGTGLTDYAVAIQMLPPKPLSGQTFDSAIVLIKCESVVQCDGVNLPNWACDTRLVWTRFLGPAQNCLDTSTGAGYSDFGGGYGAPYSDGGEIKNELDSYCADANKNKYFFVESVLDPDYTRVISGHNRFALQQVVDEKTYQSIQRILFTIRHAYDRDIRSTLTIRIYELALMFVKSLSISNSVYAQFCGRNFGGSGLNTWGARKTAADPILYLTDWAEMVARLQDWSETGETKDWGHEYATASLIETGAAEGSFDSTDLLDWQTMPIAYQNEDYGNCWSDTLLREIATQNFLTFYQDPISGKERIGNIAKRADTLPTTTITLADIKGSIGRVSEPSAVSIYCEPLIRYKKNRGSGEYEGLLAITNTSAVTFDPSYISGVTNPDAAQILWTMAHVLRLNVDQVVPPPSDITDNNFIFDEHEAIKLMLIWLSWMGATNVDNTPTSVIYQPKQRLQFSVPFEIGKDWFISKHFNLQLPFHTNNAVIECIIERLTTKISQGQEDVSVQVVTYGLTNETALFIQDTFESVPEDWQDHMQTQTERGEGHADVQGTM